MYLQALEEALQQLTLILHLGDAGTIGVTRGDDLVLLRVLELDPERLGQLRRRDLFDQVWAVLELLLEALVRLLLALVVDLLHQRVVVQVRGELAALAVRDVLGEVDADFDLVVPVVLHHADLAAEQDADPEQGQRDADGQDDGDGHRQVATQACPRLFEDRCGVHFAYP